VPDTHGREIAAATVHPEGKGADTHARKIATASVAMKSCAPGPVETNSYKIQLKAASPTYQYVLHIFFVYYT